MQLFHRHLQGSIVMKAVGISAIPCVTVGLGSAVYNFNAAACYETVTHTTYRFQVSF